LTIKKEGKATFCEQKVAKKFLLLCARAVSTPQAQVRKSFLRRFFSKKRPLAFA
jgi:hypothetical protein